MQFKFKDLILLLLILALIFIREIGHQAYLLNIRWLYFVVLSFCISYFLTPFVIKAANRFQILDYPSERKLHKEPTPRIGGISLYLAILISLVRNIQFRNEIIGLIIGGSIIFLVALLDDIFSLTALVRLIAQILASLIIVVFGFKITALPYGFPFEGILETLITIIWFVGIINAVNFLDGIDGLVSGFGSFCALLFLVLSLLTGQKHISYLSSSLLGACLGFLPYNWHKAKIFLGDCGASIIGFSLAAISVVGWWAEKNPVVSLSTPVLILSVAIYDMIYITISRIKNKQVKNLKEWIEYVGKDHLHHRLLKLGFSVPQTVGFVVLVSFCIGLYSVIIRYSCVNDFVAFLILFQTFLIFCILSLIMYVGRK
ncbi:MAG: MraY family glycosyltransferase [Elusimicrobiota bacterium]|nr:undecaprenyl/decaprenyl-phosphate alpha-N-acetylglucosaminyl 1-phosphate transferase [Endomicrobiia bacterium]MDW8165197.1 MraY family glycosyltransferase [Elusimicrobiota bacterium]